MKFLIIIFINLALIVFAKAGYLQTPHVLHSNSISSYASQQSFPGAATYQSYETLGLPVPKYSSSAVVPAITQNHIPLGYPYTTAPLYSSLSYVPSRQHVAFAHPQLISAGYPFHQPALITQNPALIQQYPGFIHQPAFINPIAPPAVPGLLPQNPSEIQPGSNIPSGAQVDADTVSVEAVRSSNSNNQQNQEDDDTVSIEAAGRSVPSFKVSNDTTQAIFPPKTESSSSSSSSTTESSSSSTSTELPSSRSNYQQSSIDERFRNLNQLRLDLQSNPNLISRNFFGNPSVFARFNLQ